MATIRIQKSTPESERVQSRIVIAKKGKRSGDQAPQDSGRGDERGSVETGLYDQQCLFMEDTPVPMLLLAHDGAVRYANPKAEAVLGYTMDHLVKNGLPLSSDNAAHEMAKVLFNACNGYQVEQKSSSFVRADGGKIRVMLSVTPLFAQTEIIWALLCVFEDVSRLRFLEEKFHKYFNKDSLAKKIVDLKSWTIPIPEYFSAPEAEKKFRLKHLTDEMPLLLQILRAFPRYHRAGIGKAFRSCILCGDPIDMRAMMRMDGENVVAVRVTGRLVDHWEGAGKQLEIGVVDISDQAENEQKLWLQLAALESVENMVVITDVQGNIEWANPSYCRVAGCELEDRVGQPLWELVQGRAKGQRGLDRMWENLLSGQVWKGEMKAQSEDGRDLLEEMTISPICREDSGEISHFVVVMDEVSEKRSIEMQVIRSERMDSLGALAGGIAHDLNNVFSPILMGLDLMKFDPTSEENSERISSIMHSAQRGADLVMQILTFVRGGEDTRDPCPVDLDITLRELHRMISRTFSKNIEVTFEYGKDLWPVMGDPTQIYQVILNLCMNARDAMPEGGRLSVRLRNVITDDSLQVDSDEIHAGPHVQIEVQDTGTGIPPECRDKLFDPFFTTKPPGKGTGLGLATLAQIVRKHGGRVDFESEVGEGTTFIVMLPSGNEWKGNAYSKGEGAMPLGSGQTVLLVDDETPIRNFIRDALEHFGYEVLAFPGGVDAIKNMEAAPDAIDLLVVDMDMPGMNGPEIIRKAKALKTDLPVLGCSGHASHVIIDDAYKAGMDIFVSKPFTARAFLEQVATLF